MDEKYETSREEPPESSRYKIPLPTERNALDKFTKSLKDIDSKFEILKTNLKKY